jgi:hypothetical protein
LEFLSEFDFDIKHTKGTENKVVDALNRKMREMHATSINMYFLELKNIILEVVASNQHYAQVIEGLQ